MAESIEPKPAAATAADKALARAYLTQERQLALKNHPNLSSAYQAEDQLKKIARDSLPLSESVQVKIDNTIRNSIVTALSLGQTPKVSERAEEAMRLKVALDNAEHAIGTRKFENAQRIDIRPEQRTLLVEKAEEKIVMKISTHQPEVAHEAHLRATEIAGLIAKLDMPNTQNPFRHPQLVKDYKHQQDTERKQMQQRDQIQEKGRERGR